MSIDWPSIKSVWGEFPGNPPAAPRLPPAPADPQHLFRLRTSLETDYASVSFAIRLMFEDKGAEWAQSLKWFLIDSDWLWRYGRDLKSYFLLCIHLPTWFHGSVLILSLLLLYYGVWEPVVTFSKLLTFFFGNLNPQFSAKVYPVGRWIIENVAQWLVFLLCLSRLQEESC